VKQSDGTKMCSIYGDELIHPIKPCEAPAAAGKFLSFFYLLICFSLSFSKLY